MKRPLIDILRIGRLCFTNEIRLNVEHDSLSSDLLSEDDRRPPGRIKRIDVDSKNLDLLRQGQALPRLQFRDGSLIGAWTIFHEQHTCAVLCRYRSGAQNEKQANSPKGSLHW